MRLLLLNFLLLAGVAIASSEERHKRHFPLLIKLIKSAIFGPEENVVQEVAVSPSKPEYEVFRLPGHDNVVVKVSPKMSAEGVVYREVEPVNLKAFGSVVGIESPDDTLSAVREVDKLLSSGILYGGYEDLMNDHIVAMFPGIRTVEEEIVPVIEARPDLLEVIQPLEERVEFEVPLDLYEQNNVREQATVITPETKPGTELVASIPKNELPNCIRRRIDAAVLLGADPNRFTRVQKVYSAPVVELIHPRLGDPLIEKQIHKKILKGFETVADFGLPTPLLVSQERVKSLKPIHSEDVEVIVSKHDGTSENEKLTAFTSTGKEVDLSQTLGPIPSWYLERMKVTDLKTNDQSKPVVIEPFIENTVSQPAETEEVLANTEKPLKTMVLKPHPLYVQSSNPVHLEDVQVSFPKHEVKPENVKITAFTSNGKKVDLSKTLESIPTQYLKRNKVTAYSKNNDQPKPIVIAPSKDVKKVVVAPTDSKTNVKKESAEVKPDQKAQSKENYQKPPHVEIVKVSAKPTTVHNKEEDQVKLFQITTTKSPPKADISDEKDSGYVYVNHPNPITVKLVKETKSDAPKTNVITNNDNNLKVVTPVKIIEPAKATVQLKDGEKAEPKRIVVPFVTSMNPLKTNELKLEKPSLDLNPVVILNSLRSKESTHQKHFRLAEPHVKTYSYQQKQADGSSINVEADHNVISVDFKGRGDIPDK